MPGNQENDSNSGDEEDLGHGGEAGGARLQL